MKIAIIADDLTGGNGTGVKLGEEGFTPATVIFGAPFPTDEKYNALVIDTDSRYCSSSESAVRVSQAVTSAKQWGASLYTKRIDSTFRGNIGVELETILGQLGSKSIAFVVPAFPDSGRTMVNGVLYVHGVPLHKTDVAKDPVQPIIESHIPSLLQQQTKHPVTFIDIQCKTFKTDIAKGLQAHSRIFVCDAQTNSDIELIAQAMASLPTDHVISVDPGPLTMAFAKAKRNESTPPSRVLVAIGSATAATTKQLQYLMEQTKIEPIYVNPAQLASFTSSWEIEIDRVTTHIKDKLDQSLLIITTQLPGHTLLNLKEIAETEGVTEKDLAKRITDGLAVICHQLLNNKTLQIKGCFSSGGDVTASLCTISLANGIELQGEVMPLAAYGTLIGGHFDNLPIVTKGGLVGDDTAIYQCVKYLQNKLLKGESL
ncbi:four-carbon acid sugar kinase family protein [Bacillus alkalicellulosilyticus]|uniref:four-carbon acid sugar kinase family protein n=1 Tax=Alkalihalobacterium alkalicellulosilyticum TaxID=1912214 RepID=UPI000996C79F|nr:four-carbon acid sugar kinase family protein [Bacillus alkalicellulosilyticus]